MSGGMTETMKTLGYARFLACGRMKMKVCSVRIVSAAPHAMKRAYPGIFEGEAGEVE